MLIAALHRRLPGPPWLRTVLLVVAFVGLGVLLWYVVFPQIGVPGQPSV